MIIDYNPHDYYNRPFLNFTIDKRPNYRVGKNYIWFEDSEDVTESSSSESDGSGSDFQDSADESVESEDESSDFQASGYESSESSEESGRDGKAMRGSRLLCKLKQQNGRQDFVKVDQLKSSKYGALRNPERIALGSNESDQDHKPSPVSSTVASTKLKLVFDVE